MPKNRLFKLLTVAAIALVFPRSTQKSISPKQTGKLNKNIENKPLTQHDQKPDD